MAPIEALFKDPYPLGLPLKGQAVTALCVCVYACGALGSEDLDFGLQGSGTRGLGRGASLSLAQLPQLKVSRRMLSLV